LGFVTSWVKPADNVFGFIIRDRCH
jgi:hypothetical protein